MSNNNSPPTASEVAAISDTPMVGLSFSPRERQVAELIAQGLSNREIGLTLGISYLTVKVHVRRVYAKIGVANRIAAVLYLTRVQPNLYNGNGHENSKIQGGNHV